MKKQYKRIPLSYSVSTLLKLLMQQQEFVPQKCAGHMSEKESQRNDSSRA